MKTLKLISILFLLFSCKTNGQEKTDIISPIENLKYGNTSKYITEENTSLSLSTNIEANLNVNNLRFISTNNYVYVIDNLTKKIQKTFKFKFTELKLELLSVELLTNLNKTKVLVITSSGQDTTALVFQIDISSLKIDWLTEYSNQITASSFTNDSKIIALGTGYYKENETSEQYFSTLFLLNSETGKLIEYFDQGESVAQIKFSEDNKLLLAVLDWPHVDTFVWNLQNKGTKIGAFGIDSTSFYNACDFNENYFISIGSDGIYKWNKTNSKDFEIVYKSDINGSDKIYKFENMIVLIDYPHGSANPPIIKYFDSKIKLIDSIKLNTSFNKVTFNDLKLEGIDDNNKIVSFDLKKKTVELLKL